MNLSEKLYRMDGQKSFGFWLDSGWKMECVIFDTETGTHIGLLETKAWDIAKGESSGFKEGTAVKALIRFKSMKVLKKGWFALSVVEFLSTDGEKYSGKTDKGFVEFLATKLPPHP